MGKVQAENNIHLLKLLQSKFSNLKWNSFAIDNNWLIIRQSANIASEYVQEIK